MSVGRSSPKGVVFKSKVNPFTNKKAMGNVFGQNDGLADGQVKNYMPYFRAIKIKPLPFRQGKICLCPFRGHNSIMHDLKEPEKFITLFP